jgi:hypothetical protein
MEIKNGRAWDAVRNIAYSNRKNKEVEKNTPGTASSPPSAQVAF